ETNPHAHISIVPIIKGKLCAKELMTMKFLYEIQEEFPRVMRERGFDVERGEGGDPKERRKHLSEEEYRLKAWSKDLKEKEEGLKKFEQRLEDKLEALEVPRQALQDALGGPQLQLEAPEPLLMDKNKVKINKDDLEKLVKRAELSNNLLATIGADRLKLRQQQDELNRLSEATAEQKRLADRRAELLRELESEHRMIMKENAEVRDRNTELYIANARLKDYINHKGLSDDFEDWAGALREAQEALEAELELF
ncbi:MAG: plasmid recombination protein, partial [Eubacteriales bacterium]|nr:plasmid recombination protein [Eubacteriales bacterium]